MSNCTICDGVGLVRVVDGSGNWVSRPCECQDLEREQRRMAAAHIPERYRQYTLDGYETAFRGAHPSLGQAHLTARKFVEAYPVDTAGKGLLFTGSVGVGKTHLAVGVLRRLVQERGVRGLFCDYRELLKSIQNSYNPQVQTTELELLRPVFAAEVLVLDDLGAQKPNEWVWDTVALILNYPLQRQADHHHHHQLSRSAGGRQRPLRSRARGARADPGRPHRRPHALPSGGDVRPRGNDRRGLPPDRQARPLRLTTPLGTQPRAETAAQIPAAFSRWRSENPQAAKQ